jgi:5-methylcytosine-specific restriction endonuclease McrA
MRSVVDICKNALWGSCQTRGFCAAGGNLTVTVHSIVDSQWGLSAGELAVEEAISSGMQPPLQTCRALLLDVSYRPIDILSWQRAMMLSMLSKAEVLEWHDGISVRSARQNHPIPAVLKVGLFLGKRAAPLSATRRNVMERDDGTCQYCAAPADTIDHVIPSSRGGKWEWTNLVAACSRCNSRKAANAPAEAGMRLKRMPVAPCGYGMHVNKRLGQYAHTDAPPQWAGYVR